MLKRINILLLVLLVVLLGAYLVMSPASWVIYKQLAAVRSGDLEKAYGYTTSEFQNLTTFDEFRAYFEQFPVIKNSESLTIKDALETDQKVLVVKGVLKGKDGKETPIVYELLKEKNIKGFLGGWRIQSLKIEENGEWKSLSIKIDVSNDLR